MLHGTRREQERRNVSECVFVFMRDSNMAGIMFHVEIHPVLDTLAYIAISISFTQDKLLMNPLLYPSGSNSKKKEESTTLQETLVWLRN